MHSPVNRHGHWLTAEHDKQRRADLESGVVSPYLENVMDRFQDMASCVHQFEVLLCNELERSTNTPTSSRMTPEDSDYLGYLYNDFLGTHLRQGFFLGLMSAIESVLRSVCDDVAFLTRISWERFQRKERGSLISRSRKFLEHAGVFAAPASKNWELIESMNTLRNKLVHTDGHANGESAARISSLAGSLPGLNFEHGFVREIGSTFSNEAFRMAEIFLTGLIAEMMRFARKYGDTPDIGINAPIATK